MFFFEDKKNKFDCGSICVVPRIIKLILLENETKCESALTQIHIHNEIHHMYEIFTESWTHRKKQKFSNGKIIIKKLLQSKFFYPRAACCSSH